MTEQELLSELREDFFDIFQLSDIKSPKVDRIIRKTSVFPVRVHSFVTSKRKNKWLVLWTAYSRKNVGNNSLVHFVVYYETDHGKYAIMPTFIDDEMITMMFAPHFFQRFADRIGLDLTGIDLIKRFFECNHDWSLQYKLKQKDSTTGEMSVFATSEEGIAMGIQSVSKNIILFRTFLAPDMCKGDQVEIFDDLKEIREEKHKENIKL